jgi:hypothetical protein
MERRACGLVTEDKPEGATSGRRRECIRRRSCPGQSLDALPSPHRERGTTEAEEKGLLPGSLLHC